MADTHSTGESRFRFESGALRATRVYTAIGCQPFAGASPLRLTKPAERRASSCRGVVARSARRRVRPGVEEFAVSD